jgi:serine/threonine protein kinase
VLLETIPAGGPMLGLTITMEIDDVDRLGSARKLVGYASLARGSSSRGRARRIGPLSKVHAWISHSSANYKHDDVEGTARGPSSDPHEGAGLTPGPAEAKVRLNAMAQVGEKIGRYEVLRRLGSGGMAVVYLAKQTDLDRFVALKEMRVLRDDDPSFAKRFLRESRMAGSLNHPNIVTVYDYFEWNGTPYIAMEYVQGGSLRPYMGQLTLAQRCGVLEDVLAGLDVAQQRNIVHRDLKPENLLITWDGHVKIADFGIAKATKTLQSQSFVTAAGKALGTPTYIAPEQLLGGDIGPATDLYSLGCVAFELFIGRPPFEGDDQWAVMYRHANEPIPELRSLDSTIDAALSAWVAQLVQKDPRQRPPSAAAASDELEEIAIQLFGPRWRREARLSPAAPERGGQRELAPAPLDQVRADTGYASFAWGGHAPAGEVDAAAATPAEREAPGSAPERQPSESEPRTPELPQPSESETPVSEPKRQPSESETPVSEPKRQPSESETPVSEPTRQPSGGPVAYATHRPVPRFGEAAPSGDLGPSGAPDLPPKVPDPSGLVPAVPVPAPAPGEAQLATTVAPRSLPAPAAPQTRRAVRARSPQRRAGAVAAAVVVFALLALLAYAVAPTHVALKSATLGQRISSRHVTVRVPTSWKRYYGGGTAADLARFGLTEGVEVRPPRAATGAALLAGVVPSSDPSLLAPAVLHDLSNRRAQPQRVRLGTGPAYRYANLSLRSGGGPATLLALPTSAGVATLVCRGARSSTVARACDAIGQTLRIRAARTFAPPPRRAFAGALNAIVAPLATTETRQTARMRQAKTARALAGSLRQVAAAYQKAARATARIRPALAEVATLDRLRARFDRLAGLYGELSSAAARRQAGRYARLKRSTSAAAVTWRRELARALGALGYHLDLRKVG